MLSFRTLAVNRLVIFVANVILAVCRGDNRIIFRMYSTFLQNYKFQSKNKKDKLESCKRTENNAVEYRVKVPFLQADNRGEFE